MSYSKKSTKGKASGMNSQKQPQKARVQNNNNNMKPRLERVREAPARRDRAAVNNNPVGYNRTGMRSELIGPLTSATAAFHVLKRLRCNPLSTATFNWLPAIARNFESFKFHYLAFRYENRCSTTQAGSKIMSPSYDAADSSAQAANEQLLYTNRGTIDAAVWRNDTLKLSTSSMNRLYKHHTCMSDERFANTAEDQKTIDPAQVFICLDGISPAIIAGKLFVDYDVEFFDPHSPTEPISSGGQVMDYGTTTSSPSFFVAGSNLPIVGGLASPLTRVDEENPVFTSYNANGSPFNTSAVAQFARDYSGILDVVVDSSGTNTFTSTGSFFTGTNRQFSAGSPGDIALGILDGIDFRDPTLEKIVQSYKVVAKAGDYLKWISPSATASSGIQSLRMQLGGSTVF